MKKDGVPSLTKRVIAYLLDLLIINVVIVLPFEKIIGSYTGLKINGLLSLKGDITLSISIFLILLLTLLYFSILEFKTQQTIGKMIIGLYVYTKKPDYNKFLIRNLTKPFFLLLIIDTLYLLIKRNNKRFTEVISQTEVRSL